MCIHFVFELSKVLLLLVWVVESRTVFKYCYSEAMSLVCLGPNPCCFCVFTATISWWFRPGDRARVMTTNPKPNKALKVRRAGPAWAVAGTVLAWHREDSSCPGSPTFTALPLENEVSFVLRNWGRIPEGEWDSGLEEPSLDDQGGSSQVEGVVKQVLCRS